MVILSLRMEGRGEVGAGETLCIFSVKAVELLLLSRRQSTPRNPQTISAPN